MKADDQKKLNNLYHRYQNYDNDGTKYVYDIFFDTLSGERQLKAKRHTGVEKFREHIEELMENFKDVCSITVTDFAGKSPRASQLNPPMTIYLLDVKSMDTTPKVIVHGAVQSEVQAKQQVATDIFQGLSGLFAGTEYEGLGSIAPMAKLIDDRHVINRLQEKNEEQLREISELKRQNNEWQQKYETLNGNFERLQDDSADMEDELSLYREQDRKQDRWVTMLGAAGASMAKTFLRQNPKILSGIIPAEQLAGILSDDEPQPAEANNQLTDEEQNRLDDATTVFEWLQTLDAATFAKIITVIAAMRQSAECTDRIIAFLKGR
ncbi:MAG: hypothetical protein LBV41_01800 [Cytophagaceae bacterium]|jgi:hypothetical protein|nr:hypothetical protein [Cytophagaceae bacterium]